MRNAIITESCSCDNYIFNRLIILNTITYNILVPMLSWQRDY